MSARTSQSSKREKLFSIPGSWGYDVWDGFCIDFEQIKFLDQTLQQFTFLKKEKKGETMFRKTDPIMVIQNGDTPRGGGMFPGPVRIFVSIFCMYTLFLRQLFNIASINYNYYQCLLAISRGAPKTKRVTSKGRDYGPLPVFGYG